MKSIFTILILLTIQRFTFSQEVSKDYYLPYKQIIEKQTLSYGYVLYNFTPVLFSRFTVDPNTQKVDDETKFKEKFLSGWSNRSIEAYQFWAFKKSKGFDFSLVNSFKNYNLFDSAGLSPTPLKRFEKAETSLEVGWQGFKEGSTTRGTSTGAPLGGGVAISINKSYFYTLDNNDFVRSTIDLGPYLGVKFKLGVSTISKVKARFGFNEYFYVKYCGNGQQTDENGHIVNSASMKYLNMGGGIRFYRMSKSIRTIGICYTYFDARADYQTFFYDSSTTPSIRSSKDYFSIPLFFGIGLSW